MAAVGEKGSLTEVSELRLFLAAHSINVTQTKKAVVDAHVFLS